MLPKDTMDVKEAARYLAMDEKTVAAMAAGFEDFHHHDALDDSRACAAIMIHAARRAGAASLDELGAILAIPLGAIGTVASADAMALG